MKRFLLTILMVHSSFLLSGEATFSGHGKVSSKPEFVTLNITVHSQCYATSHKARLANDEVVSKIQGQLGKHVTANGVDKVFSSGGWTSPFSATVWDGEKSVTVCQNTFQKMTNIEFKTSNIEGFSEIFATIQDEILPQFESIQDGADEFMTYVTISQPFADVSEETRDGMRYKARQNALRDAKHKLLAYINDDGFGTKVKIVGISDQSQSYSMERSFAADVVVPMPPMSGGRPVVDISFQDAYEDAFVNVKFNFKNIKIITQN